MKYIKRMHVVYKNIRVYREKYQAIHVKPILLTKQLSPTALRVFPSLLHTAVSSLIYRLRDKNSDR